MSVQVLIDGQPANQTESCCNALDTLGPIPDESDRVVEVWTRSPEGSDAANAVWLNSADAAAEAAWLKAGGTAISTRSTPEASLDRIRQWHLDVSVTNRVNCQLDAGVLAAFLVHDFPLIDAWMLARAFNGRGWPYELSAYPVPLGGPSSPEPFAAFPRHVGLYAVVPTVDWVARLCELGVPVIQIRDKRSGAEIDKEAMHRAIQRAAESESLLFINDHWELAIRQGAYGVHLGQEDIDTADLDAIRGAGLRLGISTHGIYEMLRAHTCRPSYMALGAIYATATKEMPTTPQGLRRLKHYVSLMTRHYPLVAIGGLDQPRIAAIWETGVDCAAVLRAIVDARDYRWATLELLKTALEKSQVASAA